MLGKEIVAEFHTNYDLLNPLVAANIDYKTPEPGEVIYKLCMIAKERNIDYMPSQDSQSLLISYCNLKGI